MDNEDKEEVCRQLRATAQEFGQEALANAVIIGNAGIEHCGGHQYIHAPTVSITTLGLCDFKVARFFEDA